MRIMVLTADQAQLQTIQDVLQRAGHEVLPVTSSQAAWDLLEDGQTRFVIADRGSSDIDQQEFIPRLRSGALHGHAYVIMLLPRAPEQDHAGADDYLFKPVSAAELKSRVAIGERILGLGDNLSEAKDQLEKLALVDAHTGLLNQKAFLSAAAVELERARRSQSPFSLIAVDVRDFPSLTEYHGEDTANDVLRLLAQLVREKCRPYDCIGRWDANQFVIALPAVPGVDAEKIVERLLGSMRSTEITTTAGQNVRIELGAGIAASARTGPATAVEDFIQQSLQALARGADSTGTQIYLTYL